MRRIITSTILALLLGSLAAPPAGAQEGSRTRDRADQDRRAQGAQQERQASGRDRQQAQRPRDQQRRTARGQLTGEVVQKKRVDVRGTDRQHLVVLLKTEEGNRVPVDLGSPGRLGDDMPSVGDQITIRGRLVRIGDRGVVIGEQLQAGQNRPVRIDQRPPRTDRNRQQERRSAQRPQTESEQANGGRAQERHAALGVALASDPQADGVRVIGVLRGSPADQAGIEPGDVITSVNGTQVTTPQETVRAVTDKAPGEQLEVTLQRDGEQKQVTAQLESRGEILSRDQQRQGGNEGDASR